MFFGTGLCKSQRVKVTEGEREREKHHGRLSATKSMNRAKARINKNLNACWRMKGVLDFVVSPWELNVLFCTDGNRFISKNQMPACAHEHTANETQDVKLIFTINSVLKNKKTNR